MKEDEYPQREQNEPFQMVSLAMNFSHNNWSSQLILE